VQYEAAMILPISSDDAFEQLLRAHERQVLRLAVRLTGNLEDGQDVAQEVFLKLHREFRSLRSPEDVGRWLYRVTVNAAFDSRRKNKRAK
jgi:RNA polymerase sigma-70 factor (ECF subfamily)